MCGCWVVVELGASEGFALGIVERIAWDRGSLAPFSSPAPINRFSAMDWTAFFDFFVPNAAASAARAAYPTTGAAEAVLSSASLSGSGSRRRKLLRRVTFFASCSSRLLVAGSKTAR